MLKEIITLFNKVVFLLNKKGNTNFFNIYIVKGENMKKIYENKKIILIIGGIVILILSLVLYLFNDNKKTEDDIALNITIENITSKKEIKERFYVDVKGSVKKPGVYEFKENDRVIDAIKMAGGLKKNANTDNINLSEKLKGEMVIYVYSDSEVKKGTKALSCDTICQTKVIEVNNCVPDVTTKVINNELININTASITELQTLTGIGESKAKNIIDYRETNGSFKKVEEIKNISGIGDALFEKIKDKITVWKD